MAAAGSQRKKGGILVYCKRCGTPLRPGARLCPRCGAPVRDGASARPPRPGKRAVAVAAGMLVLALLLLAAAVWSQWDQMGALFEQSPVLPAPRPGQGGVEKAAAFAPFGPEHPAGAPLSARVPR